MSKTTPKHLSVPHKLALWVKNNFDAFLSIVSIILACWLGGIGTYLSYKMYVLARKQDITSVDLQHFSKLLEKTDTILTLSRTQIDTMAEQYILLGHTLNVLDSQLAINEQTQREAHTSAQSLRTINTNNYMKAYLSFERLYDNFYFSAIKENLEDSLPQAVDFSLKFRESLSDILNNTIVLENKNLAKKIDASLINIYNFQMEAEFSHLPKYMQHFPKGRSPIPSDTITPEDKQIAKYLLKREWDIETKSLNDVHGLLWDYEMLLHAGWRK